MDDLAFWGEPAAVAEVLALIRKRYRLKVSDDRKCFVGILREVEPDGSVHLSQPHLLEKAAHVAGVHRRHNKVAAFPALLGSRGYFVKEDLRPEGHPDRKSLDKFPYVSALYIVAYVAMCTRPDLLHRVSYLQKLAKNYGPVMIKSLCKLVQYALDTSHHALVISAPNSVPLAFSTDASFASDPITMRSCGGCIEGTFGSTADWTAKGHQNVNRSSTEAEIHETSESASKVLHAHHRLWEMPMPMRRCLRLELPMRTLALVQASLPSTML